MCKLLPLWKDQAPFLNDAHSQVLQQALVDLHRAFVNYFAGRAEHPDFKRKFRHDSFRFPQGFELDEPHSRIRLPKLGWMRYRNSRPVLGTVRNVTVSRRADRWFVSLQTERVVTKPVHPLDPVDSAIGIDMGVKVFAALAAKNGKDPDPLEALDSFRRHERKLAHLQRELARKQKFSGRWKKQKSRIARMYRKIADVRNDFLHKASTKLCKNHALICVEDLKIVNMTKSAKGTSASPGKHVAAKSGLNKAILDQGWGEFRRQLAYKLAWSGGTLIRVDPKNTSRKCAACGHTEKENRISQAKFVCRRCGHADNADHNAARNILAAGLVVYARGEGNTPPVKREELSHSAGIPRLQAGEDVNGLF
jgi:putative transposase